MQKSDEQLKRFQEAAKDADTDTSDDALDKVFGKIKLKRETEKKKDAE